MRNKFFTKKGWLTPYALACGYLHSTEVDNYHVVLESNNPELNTFQVRTFSNKAWENNRWYVIEGIEAARNLYILCCYMEPSRRYESNQDINRIVYG